jgi:NAD(P)-dependent dehydrogenase (short-subunit alcohol dehydrogenase family)
MKKDFCLITGAAGFLGFHYTKLLIKNGYNVVGVDKNKNLQKRFKHHNFLFYNCDISDEKQVSKIYSALNKKKIFISSLINNAAINSIPKNTINNKSRLVSTDIWDLELNVSLKGSYLMIKYFGERMIRHSNGSIINIGSDLSLIAPDQRLYKSFKNFIKPVTYSVIKHGLHGMTKYFAALYAKNKVRVNMLSPGAVFNNHKKEFVSKVETLIPMGRMAKINDFDTCLLFLLDKKSKYITGQNIVVDGGRTII